jgi:hypothetical protein
MRIEPNDTQGGGGGWVSFYITRIQYFVLDIKVQSDIGCSTTIMLRVERIEKILSVLAVSGYVKNSRPISAVLIAPSDGGKTQLLLRHLPFGARVVNDFTFGSMIEILDAEKPPKWIVVPDFNAVISHRPTVATLTLAFLLALLAEGVTEIPGLEGKAKLKAEKLRERGIRISLLTAMTPEMFHSRRGKWRQTGLLRRIAPIYYSYAAPSVSVIQSAISKGADRADYQFHAGKPGSFHDVTIPETYTAQVSSLAEMVASTQLVWQHRSREGDTKTTRALEYPFSVHKTFRAYVKSSALLNHRSSVNKEDMEILADFSRFVRYDRPEEI